MGRKLAGLYVSSSEAAAILGVSRRRVNQFISENRLPAKRLGKDYLLLASDVRQFAASDYDRRKKANKTA